MSFPDLFGTRLRAAPRTSCPFCPGLAAASPSALCNVCMRHAGREGSR